MSLTSASTSAQVRAAYIDNASYQEDRDLAKAKAFAQACRILILTLPKSSGSAEAQIQLNPEMVQRQLDDCVLWIRANDPANGPAITRTNFNYSRTP